MDKLPALVKSRAMGGGTASVLAPRARRDLCRSGQYVRRAAGSARACSKTGSTSSATASNGGRRSPSATPSIWPVVGLAVLALRQSRRDPFTGGADFHPGLDISADYGSRCTPPPTASSRSAGPSGTYGNLVVIDHGYGIMTRYGHCRASPPPPASRVHRGDVIGYVGSTGRSTSSHLHYEILLNGQLTNPLKLLAGR